MSALDRRLKGRSGPFDQTVAREALGSQDDPESPISVTAENADRRKSGFFTFASVIWEIGSEITALVAPGAPSDFDYQGFRLARRSPVSAVAE
jgi:hypothetical protein